MKPYDLIVVGAGPGGYVSAIYGAKHGLRTAIIEKNESLGGTCLNVGCIPTKSMIESANLLRKIKNAKDFGVRVTDSELDYPLVYKRKNRVVSRLTKGIGFLMKENNIDVYTGTGAFKAPGVITVDGETELGYKNCIIATGSQPADLPHIQADGEFILNSDHALSLEELPGSMAIIGGGVIGVEFASIFATFGVQVTIIELMDQLIPGMDTDVAEELRQAFKKMKVKVHTGAGVSKAANGVVTFEQDGETHELTVDKVLLSVGRRPYVDGLNLDALAIETDRGHVPVDENLRTSAKGVYAIGDVIDTLKLAHLASREGMKVIHHLCNHEDSEDFYMACPGVVYSYPEIAAVGLTEAEAAEKGLNVQSVTFPLTANSKAYVEGIKSGFVKVVSQKETGRLLGVHIIGGKASEMIGEATTAIQHGLTVEQMGRIIHPHPTMSESLMEAFHMATGLSVHI